MPADVLAFANQDLTNLDTAPPPLDRATGRAYGFPSHPVRVYDPISNPGRIDTTQRRTEFELQAWLYNRLQLDGFDVRGEVKGKTDAGERARFDLIVYVGDRLIAIIEVKDSPGSRLERTRQGRRYRTFGVPVFLFFNGKQYPQLRTRMAELVDQKRQHE